MSVKVKKFTRNFLGGRIVTKIGLTQNIHKFRDFKTFLRVGLRKSWKI